MASSIHIEAVKTSSFTHNDRSMKVSYLIGDSSKNYCSVNAKTAMQNFNHYKEISIQKYKEITNQKMQSKTIFIKEAIINLEAHHTEKDLEPIIKKLENYGFKTLQVAIHRDEGFKNKETSKNEYNYHAHITMFNLDLSTGKSVKFGKNYRTELSKLQTFVANALNMERGKISDKTHAIELGKEYDPNQTRRLGTHQYKRAMKEQEEKRIEQKQEINYKHKEYQAKITALENVETALKKELHTLNNEIARIKNEEISKGKKIEELEKKIKMYENTFNKIAPEAQSTNEVIQHIALNRTETAQKLAEKENTINVLTEEKESLSLAVSNQKSINVNLKEKLEKVERNKKIFLDHYQAPLGASFWGFLKEKFEEFGSKIKELTLRVSKLEAENKELKENKLTPLTLEEEDTLRSLAAQADYQYQEDLGYSR